MSMLREREKKKKREQHRVLSTSTCVSINWTMVSGKILKAMMKEKTPILIFKIFPWLQSLTRGGLAHKICSLRYCIKTLKITCYTVLIERRTEKKCNAIVSLLEVLISTKKTTSTTSWSTLLMICQNFAMSNPNAIHLWNRKPTHNGY